MVSFGYMPRSGRSGIAGSYGNSVFKVFLFVCLFLRVQLAFPTMQEGSLFSTASPAFVTGALFNGGHS